MAREIWATMAYGGGTHPSGVPDEQQLLDAWAPWATRLSATVKTTRFIAKTMLDHTSVTETQQYNAHRTHADARLDKMMIDPGGSTTDPDNYYDMDGLMLDFTPADGISDLYDDPLAEHETYNAHWLQAEQAYVDELAARNLTPDILHYRTVFQPLLRTDLTYPAAKATRHDDLIASLGSGFYPLTLPRLGPRNYVYGAGDSTVASVEQLSAANVAENARILSEGSVTADIVPVIFLRYEGSGQPLFLNMLPDDLAVPLLRAALDSMVTGGFAVWHAADLGGGVTTEANKIKEWLALVLGSMFLGSSPIDRTPDFDSDIDRTPDFVGGAMNRTPDLTTDFDRTPDIAGGVIDRTPAFSTERI